MEWEATKAKVVWQQKSMPMDGFYERSNLGFERDLSGMKGYCRLQRAIDNLQRSMKEHSNLSSVGFNAKGASISIVTHLHYASLLGACLPNAWRGRIGSLCLERQVFFPLGELWRDGCEFRCATFVLLLCFVPMNDIHMLLSAPAPSTELPYQQTYA